jgi:hypothetical protein
MLILTEYAVRIKGTQCYLPRSQRRDGRGGSHLEPIDFSKPKGQRGLKPRYEQDLQIRSYATRRAAKNLLTSWLQGKFTADGDGGGYLIKGSSREHMRESMEIVEIHITLPL